MIADNDTENLTRVKNRVSRVKSEWDMSSYENYDMRIILDNIYLDISIMDKW